MDKSEVVLVDGKEMTRGELAVKNREKAKERGNLDGTEVELFTGKKITVKTSFDEDKVFESEARSNSIGIAHLLMGSAPKKKVGKSQLMNLLKMAYFLGSVNTAKEFNYRMEHFYDDEEFNKDLAQGEAQIMLYGAWKAIRNNQIGKQVFLNVELEQIMRDEDLNKFIRMPKNVRL